MDSTLKRVLELLDQGDVETRCAALLVLTRLAINEDRVVHAVGAVLDSRNVVVRDFAVGYFEAVRPPAGLPLLVPLLDDGDDALRQRVVSMLVPYGAAAVTAARKVLKDAPRRRLNAIIDLCARVRSAAALDVLFDLMAGDDFDSNRAACDALIDSVPALDERGRNDVFQRAERLAAGAGGRRSPMIAAAKLFAALGDPRARKRLVTMLDAREPAVVRTHALGAMVSCLRGQKLTPGEIDAVLPLLDEQDEAGFVRPAVRLIEDQDLERRYLPQLNRLAESLQPLVKRFAVAKLASFDSGGVVKTLIGYLTDDSYARRDQATASLKTMPAARSALMRELIATDDERKAWTIADILLVHDRSWKRDVIEALWKRLETCVEKREDRLFSAYYHFLHMLDPEALAERIRARAEHLRKSKRFAESVKWLTLMKDTPHFDAEARFAYAVADLKAHRRTVSATRRHDPALDCLRGLAATTFPLADRLRRERVLTPDDLYYIGFNLAEGHGEDRTAAREVLELLVEKHGRTKVGKAARNKLRLLPAPA